MALGGAPPRGWLAALILLAAIVVGAAAQKDESPSYKYESPPPPACEHESPAPPVEYKPPPPPHYDYKSPPPYKHEELPPPYKHEVPPPYKYESPPPPYHVPLRAVVTGAVYCDLCQDGKMKEPLEGVEVGVFCWNGEYEGSFYGKTDKQGTLRIELSGFDYEKWGSKACGAKLIAASYDTPCTIPTDLQEGRDGVAELQMKSQSEEEVELVAGPFAYKSEEKSEKCWTPVYKPAPYKDESPPPPPYKYESPPDEHASPPPPYKI